jgi:hypothetical protein
MIQKYPSKITAVGQNSKISVRKAKVKFKTSGID